MSQENVERVCEGFEAYVRGDVDKALAGIDPEIVFKPAQEELIHGRDAVLASWKRWEGTWENHEMIFEEAVDAGDRVFLTILFRGRGRGSGIDVEGRFFEVFTLREGKTVRWEEFTDRAEALEAAGLSESDARQTKVSDIP